MPLQAAVRWNCTNSAPGLLDWLARLASQDQQQGSHPCSGKSVFGKARENGEFSSWRREGRRSLPETVRIFNDKHFGQWLASCWPLVIWALFLTSKSSRVPTQYVLASCCPQTRAELAGPATPRSAGFTACRPWDNSRQRPRHAARPA